MDIKKSLICIAVGVLWGLPLLYLYFIVPEQAPAWGRAFSRRAFLLSRPEMETTIFTLIMGVILVGLGIAGFYHLWRNMSGNPPKD